MARLSNLSRSVAGRVALVTGAASGMGRATAHLLADEGARVAAADREPDGLKRVVEEMQGAGYDAEGFLLDVAEPGQIDRTVRDVVARFGGLNLLVNNAGVSRLAPLQAEDYEDAWAQTLDINLRAHARLIRACLPELQRDGAGRVVNIASTEGVGASAFVSAYTASKHGVIGLTRGLAVELGSQGVTVNCVCPGPIRTGMTSAIPDDAKNKFARRRVPLRRYGEPEEVAHATLNLLLPSASYTNGAVVIVDGGMTAQNT